MIITHEQVVRNAFMYAGGTVVFISNAVGALNVGDTFTVQDRDKPAKEFTVIKKERKSIGHFEVYGQKVQA
jgi:hypothetical protein